MSKVIKDLELRTLTVGRARSEDTKFIQKLVNPHTLAYFGQDDVEELLCKSYLSLTVKHEAKGVVAAVCFNNYPNVPSIAPSCWEEWVKKLYGLQKVNAGDTLWVQLMVYEKKYGAVFFRPLLGYLFEKCRFVEKILFVFPPGRRVFGWLEEYGLEIVPEGCANIERVQTLFLIYRRHYVLPYKLRRAVMQDNDDIVSLLHKHCPRLVDLYGEYYVAEIIALSNPDRQIIIVEYKGCAVVVFGLTSFVNYDLVNTAFKLETFYGFRKPDERDSLEEHYEDDLEPGQSAMTDFGDVITNKYKILSLAETPAPVSSVTVLRERTDSEKIMAYHIYSSDDDLALYFDSFNFAVLNNDADLMSPSDRKLSAVVAESYLKSKLSCLLLTHKDMSKKKRWSRKKEKCNLGFVPEGVAVKPKISKYYGEPNAFAIELFAAEKGHINSLPLILEGAFECYPDRDYCVCTIPSTELNLPLFNLCVRAVPRPTSNFHHELYTSHRRANYKELKVRCGSSSDVSPVRKLLSKMKILNEVLPAFVDTLEPTDEMDWESYVFLCEGKVVGFAILSEEEDVPYVTSHYKIYHWTDITRYKLGQHGTILYFVLSPIFQKHVSFLLLELHRLSGYSILYFKLTSKELHSSVRILPGALCTLLPILPTRLPEYDFIQECPSEWALPDVFKITRNPFALYISTPMLCSLPRFEVNTKIVVVGGSDVGIAFLINLIFRENPNYKLTFNNITLVSPHGVGRNASNEIRNLLLQNSGDYTTQYLMLLSLRTYINIVNGVMSHINRKEKCITVNGKPLPYDLLLLTCGKQYQMPLLEKYSHVNLQFPGNVMVINTEVDADAAMLKLEGLMDDRPNASYTIVVYGCTLDAFCCLSALLEWGVPGSSITFVEPDDDCYNHYSVFNNDDVLKAVLRSIEEQNIKRHYGYKLTGWDLDLNEDIIKCATFQSLHSQITIPCLAMFAYTPKSISSRTFVAIQQAGLILDGWLVVDPDGSTNDPCIYAAGTMTKYPRRYYADHMKHEYFNRKEIGHALAELILEKLVPEIHELEEGAFISHCTKTKNLVPQYEQPITTYCVLPGNIRYLNVRKPGLQEPLEIALGKDNYGQVLICGNVKNLQAQGYFRLHLNQFQSVETITCLAHYDISKGNIEALWGKHEALLNHLVQRFELMKISDLVKFFSEPWTCAIVHEAFARCQKKCLDVMSSLAEKPHESIIEDLLERFKKKNWSKLSAEENEEILKKFKNSEYQTQIEDVLIKFLKEKELCLPMYAQSDSAKVILANYEASPLFKPL